MRTQENLVGIDAQLEARRPQLALLHDRPSKLEGTLNNGLTQQTQVSDLRAQVAGLDSDVVQLESAYRSGREEIERIEANYTARAGDRLNTVELGLAEISETRLVALEIMQRTTTWSWKRSFATKISMSFTEGFRSTSA